MITRLALAVLLIGSLAGLAPTSTSPPRLLIIGDSLARGAYATQPGATFAARLSLALGATDSTLVYTVGQLDDAEAAWVDARDQPWDLIVLEVGINDTINHPYTEAWAARYAALVASMTPGRVVCVTPFDIGVDYLAGDLSARADAIRATPGCKIADAYSASLNRAELRAPEGAITFYGTGWTTDAMHPNNDGHALIASLILDALRTRIYIPLAHS